MNLYSKLVLISSLLLLIIPEFFFYSNDILIIFVIFPYLLRQKMNKDILYSLVFIIFFAALKTLIDNDFLLKKQFLSDLRPFIFLLFFLNFKTLNLSINFKLNYFLLAIIIVTIPNIIGLVNPQLYRSILGNYWLYEVGNSIGSNTNIAQISSLGGRFSSFFSQPGTAGVFFFITTLLSTSLLFIDKFKNNKIKILSIFFLTVFNGLISGSGVYKFGFFFIIVFYLWFNYKILRFIIVLSSVLIIILIINFFEEISFLFDFIVSGRYSLDGNIVPVLIQTNWENLIYGFTDLQRFNKVGGDSSYWMKFLQGGLIYLIGYYYLLIKVLNIHFKDFLKNAWGKSILITLLLTEFGLTSFSQPKITFFLIFLLWIFVHENSLTKKTQIESN